MSEKVSVFALFGMDRPITPLRFRWNGRDINIKKVNYVWKSKRGDTTVWHFSVSGEGAVYQLSFDTRSLIWSIDNAEPVE